MALALLLAAFTGGAMGLVWQSTGLGEEEEEVDPQAERLVAGEEDEEGKE
jgi:L-asparaginase/Glu-tRNA(Gln) amidotransferase subunit D